MELVLEVGPCNGDIAYAFEAVNAAKACDADWVKGQIYDRDRLVTKTAKTYAQAGISVPRTQYEDFGRQLTYDEWAEVKRECDRIGIGFFASVFDGGAVKFCSELDLPRYKVASGDITYEQLIRQIAETGKEVVLSTGASTGPEIARALTWIPGPVTLLACTLSYPCRWADANVMRMVGLAQLHDGPIGYSDHTVGIGAIVRARRLGAVMVEKHFTITPGKGGDHDFAITPQQLMGWRSSEVQPIADLDGSSKLGPSVSEMRARIGARRSIVAATDIPAGSYINLENVRFLRPGDGLEPWEYDDYEGRQLQVDVRAGVALQHGMF